MLIVVYPLLSLGQSFSYPVPPDTILNRSTRINYMLEHFWDEHTIADSTCFHSPKLLLDYLYLLKQTNEKDRYIHSFVTLSYRQDTTFGQILYWLDRILYDSSSPYYDEAIYLKFMHAVIASDADSVMKLIPQQRVEIMSKNQTGQLANNFSFIDKSGKESNLYEVDAPYLGFANLLPGAIVYASHKQVRGRPRCCIIAP